MFRRLPGGLPLPKHKPSTIMQIAFFNTKLFERDWYERHQGHHQIYFFDEPLTPYHVRLAEGCGAVCASVNDNLCKLTLEGLKNAGVEVVAMRCAGLDNVDLDAAERLGIQVINVPDYSPFAVAEHAVALLLALLRHLPEARSRIGRGNFSLDGLVGTELHRKTVGVIGTGHIGRAFCQIMQGFGCTVLAYDVRPQPKLMSTGLRYASLNEVLSESDLVALHCPLNERTHHLIDARNLALMKPSAILVNTSRGKLVDTDALLAALNRGKLAGYATDVYENEASWFGKDWSLEGVADERLNQLRRHPRVLMTAHQGFLTAEALEQIGRSLLNKLTFFEGQRAEGVTKASMC